MLLKVTQINDNLIIFSNSRHFVGKKFQAKKFVSLHVTITSLKLKHKTSRSFHKISRKSREKLETLTYKLFQERLF